MGRKVNKERLSQVVQTIQEHDGQLRANDLAKQLELHPQAVSRLLSVVDDETETLLCEDDRGFLGIFRR